MKYLLDYHTQAAEGSTQSVKGIIVVTEAYVDPVEVNLIVEVGK